MRCLQSSSEPMSAPPHSGPGTRALILRAEESAIELAVRRLRSGGIVAIPTETVYGLAARASDGRAVASVFAAKQRPSFNPLICHVSSPAMAEQHADVSPAARRLMDVFWPGPLSLVLPRAAGCGLSELVSAGLPTLAMRMPDHSVAIEIIERSGEPLAAPSANLSERLSPTSARDVLSAMGDRIDLIIDGGACRKGVESTILMETRAGWRLLRPGPVERANIEAITGPLLAPEAEAGVLAPGMTPRHYAPNARLRINATHVEDGEAFLAFGPAPEGVRASASLSSTGNLEEAAANLFAVLRTLDATHAAIAVAPVPEDGIGEAINDRLKRAAAKKF